MTGIVNVSGSLAASGPAGAASFFLTAYRNDIELQRAVFGFNGGAQSNTGATDRQRVVWSVASFGTNESMTITDSIAFAVPIIFGQSFTRGVYGSALAGMRASGSSQVISSSSVDFLHSALWGGIGAVYGPGNIAVGAFTVASASGFDWTAAAPVPEPGAWGLMLGGLCVVVSITRRRRAAVVRTPTGA
jgi:hypothetical protein